MSEAPPFTDPLSGAEMQAPQIADRQPDAPLSPPSWLERLPADDDNPFAKMLKADPKTGSVSLGERARLDFHESYYRGSLAGMGRLLSLDQVAQGMSPPEDMEGLTPQEATAEAARIRLDLAKQEAMPGFDGPLEGAAAFAGVLGGGMLSPEAWITRFPGVRWAIGKVFGEAAHTVAARIFDSSVSQGLIQTAVDPIVQAGSVSANLQDGWDPARTAMAFGTGLVVGGALHGAGEAVAVPLARRAERLETAAEREAFAPIAERIARESLYPPQPGEGEIGRLAAEDPSLRTSPPPGATPPPAITPGEAPPEAPTAAPGETPAAEAAAPGAAPARQFPAVEDPLVLAQRGELTAERATEIRDTIEQHFEAVENEVFGPEDAARLRNLHRRSNAAWDRADDARAKEIDAQIDEIEKRASPEDTAHIEGRGAPDHLDPEMWRVITSNLERAETSREGGVSVVADQLRYLPAGGEPTTMSEREAIAVIGRAMQAEADRGGDIPRFLNDAANERMERYGGASSADAQELVQDQVRRLQDLARTRPEALPAPSEFGELRPGELGQGPRRYVERDGERFVARANGSDVLGEITPVIGDAIGREAGPIRLPQGGAGFGEKHIEARRGAEIRGAGYPDGATFVNDVAANFHTIYQGERGRLLLAKENGAARVAVVELRPSGDGSHWSVTTAGLQRPEYLSRRKLLWRRPGPGDSPLESGSPFDSPGGQSSASSVERQAAEGKPKAGEARLAEGLIGTPVPAMPAHRVATASGQSVDVTPIVVEARDLIASSDPGYDPALQPRQRDRAASQQQVREIASRLDPERLGMSSEADRGAPIIGDDGMVESGNGRVMAIRAAYAENGAPAAAYREFLTRQGLDITGFDQPVLVRQRTTPMSPNERAAFAVDANRAATLQLSAPERAMADARNLSPDLLDLIRNPDNLEAIANRDFVRAFVESLPQAEQGAMATAEGGLSAEGLTRIRHAILARAYGGTPDGAAILSRIAETTQDEIRSISNALTAAAPQWARLRGEIEAGRVVPGVDLTPELLEAVRRTADLRNRGQTFADFLKQSDAFDVLPPRVERFMSLFYDIRGTRAAGGPRIAEGLKEYASAASKISAEPGLDLGLPAVSVDELQRSIIERARGGGDTGTLFGRERPDLGGGGDRAGGGGAERGAQIRRPGVVGLGAEPRGASAPGAGGGEVGAGRERPAAAPAVAAPERPAAEPGGAPGAGRGGVVYTGREPVAARGAIPGAAGGISGRVPVRGTPSPAGGAAGASGEAIRTLHQQAFDLADAINFPLRQGRMARPDFAGQYDNAQDVVRQRAVADFEVVSHEAGHAIERHVGQELTDLTNRFATELAPLDYDPLQRRVNEGFAEFLRNYLTGAPGYAERLAPDFAAAFRGFMADKQPAILAELDRARAAYNAYVQAPTEKKLDAIVQRAEPTGILQTIRTEGLPQTISLGLAHGYQAIFDDKAPVARAVRDLARLYRDASGNRLNLEGSTNPELLVRMAARSHQAAVRNMLDGVRPYHGIEPQGPSLRGALIKASGEPGIFGRWNDAKVKEFSNYLVARRSEVLWNKYRAGELPRRPLAMSQSEIAEAIAQAEAANPGFADAADMVHQYARQLLRKQFEGGLIDRELFDKLSKEQFYVPLYRRMDDKPLLAPDRPTAGGTTEGPGTINLIRRQTGSDRDIIDPVQGLMTQTFLVERTLAHNDIIKSFDALAEQARKAGATGVGRIVERLSATEVKAQRFDLREGIENAARQAGIDPDDTKVLLGAVADTFGDDPIMASVFRRQQTSPRGEPIVFYKDGGELKALRMTSKDEGTALYETLTSLPPVMRDWAISIGAASATALRAGIVANPVFALTNFARDQLAAAILRPGYIPFNPRGIFRELGQDKYAQMYAAAGGVAPGAAATGVHEMIVDRAIEELARKGWAVQKVGAIGDLVTEGKVFGALKAVGEAVGFTETGTRLNIMKSVFDQKKREGLSDYDAMMEAAAQATDLLDFGRHGSRTATIRSLIPFLNVHLQSLDKAKRALFDPLLRAARGDLVTEADVAAVKNAGAALGLLGVSAALGTAYAVWGAQHEAYQDANEELRATHLIIPGGAFGLPGKILLVPKPFELAIGFNLGEMLGLGLATGDPRVYGFALGGVQEVLMPPNLLNSIPIVKSYAELALNKSFFTRREIVPQHLQALTPAEQFIPGQTSMLARQIGGTLGLSPIKVEYAIGSGFGLWGKDLLAGSSAADPDAPAAALENTMFLRRFIKGADVASETTKRFWTLAGQQTGEYAQAKNTYDSMIGTFREKDAAAFLAALPTQERVYVTLQSSADEDGKAVFNADDKRLHPLTRAAQAVLGNTGYIRELQGNTQQSVESRERLALDPEHRRDVIAGLRQLSAIEQRNALRIVGEPGYAGRKLLSAEDQLAVIRAISPEAADEIAARYAVAKIAPTETVARLWPEAQQRLLAEGSEAELRDLSYDAKADGYAFEADRVKRAPKRRLPIAAPPPGPSPIVLPAMPPGAVPASP